VRDGDARPGPDSSPALARGGTARSRGPRLATGSDGPAFAIGDLKAAFKRFQSDQVTDHAAALTYYALLSLFPALLFGVALLGLFGGDSLVPKAVDYFQGLGAPPETVSAIRGFLDSATQNSGTAIGALLFGVTTSLYGASGAFGAVGRALNVIWRVEEGRPFVRRKLADVGWTLLVLVLVIVTFVLVFLGGGLASDVLGLVGMGDTAATVWSIARWPAALATALLIYAIVYFAAPNVKVRRFEWVTPGALFGVVVWLLASALFFLYVSRFASYGKTYGTFAGAVILLVWLWLTNTVMLFGAELNAVIRLRRTPQLPDTYDGPPLPEKTPATRS
jgi:membrane protein